MSQVWVEVGSVYAPVAVEAALCNGVKILHVILMTNDTGMRTLEVTPQAEVVRVGHEELVKVGAVRVVTHDAAVFLNCLMGEGPRPFDLGMTLEAGLVDILSSVDGPFVLVGIVAVCAGHSPAGDRVVVPQVEFHLLVQMTFHTPLRVAHQDLFFVVGVAGMETAGSMAAFASFTRGVRPLLLYDGKGSVRLVVEALVLVGVAHGAALAAHIFRSWDGGRLYHGPRSFARERVT